MEEMHRSHKETAWGWVAALEDWRGSRTRQRLRRKPRAASGWNTRVLPGWPD